MVDLGGPQTSLDMWSYGTLVSALWTGTHLFATKKADPENEETGVLQQIVDLLGSPLSAWPEAGNTPNWGKYSKLFEVGQAAPASERILGTAVRGSKVVGSAPSCRFIHWSFSSVVTERTSIIRGRAHFIMVRCSGGSFSKLHACGVTS